MADHEAPRNEQDEAAKPDPEDRTPEERRKVEHVTSFQGDNQQMPLEGEQAVEEGGTAWPPISSLPPDESERPGTPEAGGTRRDRDT
jgi:hypothetical protein